MKKRLWILGATTLVMAIVLATTIGVGIGAGQTTGSDGYVTETDMSVSPGSACPGDLVTISGSLAPAYAQITVEMYWDGIYDTDSVLDGAPLGQDSMDIAPYEGIVGVTQADAAGNWSMTMPAPQIVFSPSDNTELTFTGDRWTLLATSGYTDDFDNYWQYSAYGTLVVLDCAAGGVTAAAGALPSTGAPVAAMSLLGSGLLGAAGLSLSSWRRRKR
jgi:LPXTG-motif cell wall-anchored protein